MAGARSITSVMALPSAASPYFSSLGSMPRATMALSATEVHIAHTKVPNTAPKSELSTPVAIPLSSFPTTDVSRATAA